MQKIPFFYMARRPVKKTIPNIFQSWYEPLMHQYLIHIQYLGFRFHGWQRQPGVKTVESMMKKTLDVVLNGQKFKILGTSRTDAMVSALNFALAVFVSSELDPARLTDELNQNLPQDIRVTSVDKAKPGFNIINSPKAKTYHYYFSYGEKPHPFCAPFLAVIPDILDISLMKEGASLFQGMHNFKTYCTRPNPGTSFLRDVFLSRIEENDEMTASFFPDRTWVYKVCARGFMRNQVRLMMGQLIRLGRGEIGVGQIRESLSGMSNTPVRCIAPASGLMLYHIKFDSDYP